MIYEFARISTHKAEKAGPDPSPQGNAPDSLTEINIDTVRNLNGYDKEKVLQTRREWLARSRKQEKRESDNLKRRKEKFKSRKKWKSIGLCACKEHRPLKSKTLCEQCLKKHRRRNNARKKKI